MQLCRAPHGARGLKYHPLYYRVRYVGSRPAWGAWIEIMLLLSVALMVVSRPAWGAWIEMFRFLCQRPPEDVAPRMGRVD